MPKDDSTGGANYYVTGNVNQTLDRGGSRLTKPKPTWTRINRMDFGLSGFTKNLVLPMLGKREAPHNAMPNLDGSQSAPSLKRGRIDEANIDEISAGVESHPSLQQNVFLAMKISEEIFFLTKNTALVTKYEFRH